MLANSTLIPGTAAGFILETERVDRRDCFPARPINFYLGSVGVHDVVLSEIISLVAMQVHV